MAKLLQPLVLCSYEEFRIRRKRPSLRIIISSATLDAASFLDYFSAGNPPGEVGIISLEGRMYPVDIAYLQEPTTDYVRKAAEVVWSINLQVCLSIGHSRQVKYKLARSRRYPSVLNWSRRD